MKRSMQSCCLFLSPGLIFLSQHPELSTTLIDALRGSGYVSKEDCVPLRYASVLLSKGFVCTPREVGIIVEMHLRVVSYFLVPSSAFFTFL